MCTPKAAVDEKLEQLQEQLPGKVTEPTNYRYYVNGDRQWKQGCDTLTWPLPSSSALSCNSRPVIKTNLLQLNCFIHLFSSAWEENKIISDPPQRAEQKADL